jgi:DNA helicase-2/ATP-dependent DNA helicase PcrA
MFCLKVSDFNQPNILTLSTIHRAKGKEWNRVYVLGESTLQPSKYARTEEQKQQERNLMYVCATRTKNERVDIVYDPPVRKKTR